MIGMTVLVVANLDRRKRGMLQYYVPNFRRSTCFR
jgi:hypothetical protein